MLEWRLSEQCMLEWRLSEQCMLEWRYVAVKIYSADLIQSWIMSSSSALLTYGLYKLTSTCWLYFRRVWSEYVLTCQSPTQTLSHRRPMTLTNQLRWLLHFVCCVPELLCVHGQFLTNVVGVFYGISSHCRQVIVCTLCLKKTTPKAGRHKFCYFPNTKKSKIYVL